MLLPANIAYSDKYEQMRLSAMNIFTKRNFVGERSSTLSNGDIVVFRDYEQMIDRCHHSGSKFLLKRNSETIYSLDMPIDTGSIICESIIEHQNGSYYILLRTELYGYSLLDLNSLKVQHYIPDGRLSGKESFIWLNAVYCKNNSLLAVEGCYWACPGSILIVDLSQPEIMPFQEYDLMDVVDNYEGDIDFVRWEDDGSLTYKDANNRHTLSKQKLFSLMS